MRAWAGLGPVVGPGQDAICHGDHDSRRGNIVVRPEEAVERGRRAAAVAANGGALGVLGSWGLGLNHRTQPADGAVLCWPCMGHTFNARVIPALRDTWRKVGVQKTLWAGPSHAP